MLEYIDVRGIWPVYINGYIAIQLIGASRSITVGIAAAWALDGIVPSNK